MRPRTPIAAGDPVWVSVDGQEQAKAGVLVRWAGEEAMKGNAVVQLVGHTAGSHQIYPAEQLYFRRAGSHPSHVKPRRASAPAAAAPDPSPRSESRLDDSPAPSTDPYDQLIDVIVRVADKIESVIKNAESEAATAKRKARSIKTKRAVQLRRIRSALRVLRGEWRTPGSRKKKS